MKDESAYDAARERVGGSEAIPQRRGIASMGQYRYCQRRTPILPLKARSKTLLRVKGAAVRTGSETTAYTKSWGDCQSDLSFDTHKRAYCTGTGWTRMHHSKAQYCRWRDRRSLKSSVVALSEETKLITISSLTSSMQRSSAQISRRPKY